MSPPSQNVPSRDQHATRSSHGSDSSLLPTPNLDPSTLDPSQEDGLPSAKILRRAAVGITSDGRLKSGKLAGMSMTVAIFTLSWPVLVESFLNSTVGLTDTYFAAQLSVAATDAIGGAAYVMWFIGLCVMSVGIGSTAIIARSIGKTRQSVANAALGQSLLLSILIGLIVAVFVFIAAPVGGSMLSFGPDAHAAFVRYLRMIALGAPALAVLSVGIASARGSGDSIRPLFSMVIVNIVNIVVSFILSGVDLVRIDSGQKALILQNPFGFHWGVSGIAAGTVIADYVGAIFIIALLIRGKSGVVLLRKRLVPHWITLKRLVRIAVPTFLETFGMWMGNFLVILIVGFIGRDAFIASTGSSGGAAAAIGGVMGAHIIAIRVESLSYLSGFALGTAVATLVGQYLGAGAPKLAQKAIWICIFICSAIMGLGGVILITLPNTIVRLISAQPEHLNLTPTLLFIAGWVQIPFGLSIVLRSALRGAGDANVTAYLLWITTYLVRLPLVYLFSGVNIPVPEFLGGGIIHHPIFDSPSLPRLWIALCIELVIRGILYSVRFLQGRWLLAKV